MSMPAITICSNSEIQQMLIHCHFGHQPASACFFHNLTVYTRNDRRINCIQFNLRKDNTKLSQVNEGWRYGYTMIFFLSTESVEYALTDNNIMPVSHEIKSPVNAGIFDVAMSKSVQKILPKPYSECLDLAGYRQVSCVQECYFKLMAVRCDCEFPENCPRPFFQDCQISLNNRTAIESECKRNQCQVECQQVTFQSKLLDFTSSQYLQELDEYKSIIAQRFDVSDLSDDQIKNRIGSVSFFYDFLETAVITQVPKMSMLDLVASVGGLMGIYFSFTFFSHILGIF